MTVFDKGKLSVVSKAMSSIKNFHIKTEVVPSHWSADTEATLPTKSSDWASSQLIILAHTCAQKYTTKLTMNVGKH